jgi:serine phosphatase RsbU (regulator of sigma subunit)
MASIIVRERDEEPHVVHLDRMRMTIGRSVRSDIPLRDPFASRLHAVLQHDSGSVIIADIGSSNRTLVNGVALTEPRRLVQGDVILIGEAELTFFAHDKTSIPPPVTFVGGEHDQLPDYGDSTSVRDPSQFLATLHLRAVPEVSPDSTGELDKPRTDLLEIMSRVGVVLISKSSVTEVLRSTLELVFEALPAERGFVFLKQGGGVVCKLAATPTALLPRDPPPRLSRTILSRAVHDGTMVRTADAGIDPRFRRAGSVEMGAIRSVLAVPLLAGNEILGALYVDNDIRNRFADADLSVLATIAAVAAIKIEHERLQAEVQEKRRIQEELKIAGEIQARLLPMTPPTIDGWDLTGVSLPCLEVGGDYFDFIDLSLRRRDERRPRVGLAVGDVSGKGTGAALVISSVHAGLRAEAHVGECVSDVMRKLNRYLFEYAPTNRFVTLFYGELDPLSGRLTYTNAGHEPPIIIRRDGAVERLTEGGIAIGIKDDEVYEEGEVVLLPGDVFICFSDGISESVNARGEQFGVERIIEVARAAAGVPAPRVRDRIEEALSLFVGATAPVDDMTLVVATRR